MNQLEEAIAEVLASAPAPPALPALQRRVRSRRRWRALSTVAVITVALVGALGIYASIGSPRTAVRVEVPPARVPPQTTPPTTLNPRGAAANVPYVRQLVAENKLPHAAAVTRVTAEGDLIVVFTTLSDRASAEDLYEQLSRRVGCDDSYLFVKGVRVVLADGARISRPRPGFVTCAGT